MTPLGYHTVIFDLDGTLVDSTAALTDALNHSLRCGGYQDLTVNEVRGMVGEGVERLLERAFAPRELPEGAMAAFERRYDEVCCDSSRVLSDVHATLEQLRDLGVQMGVCTNKTTRFSRKILESLRLAPFFGAIVGPDVAAARKPDARHLLCTISTLGSRPGGTLFVGDMIIDVATARATGVPVAAIASGCSTRDELSAAEPDYLLERFSDLVQIVRSSR